MFERIKACFGVAMKLVRRMVCHRVIYGAMAALHGAGMAGLVPLEWAEAGVCGLYLLLCVIG